MSDVCLILEGTYPFVTGGVSTCVYQLIRETPHLNYFIIYIGTQKHLTGEYKYPIPENVKLIKMIYLFDQSLEANPIKLNINFDWGLFTKFHQKMSQNLGQEELPLILEKFFNPETRVCDPFDLLRAEETWTILEQMYHAKKRSISFIDFFYTWRFSHIPLFTILKQEIPKASMYHALCTGYAGLLGSLAKLRYGSPFLLTEHGIYTHERKIEIGKAQWIYQDDTDPMAKKNMSYFKEWWLRIFDFMGKISYAQADIITTLHNVNKNKQIELGADPRKIKLIPNGVNYHDFSLAKKEREEGVFTISLVGRVVSIKDVKGFIKAMSLVYEKNKKVKSFIIGPMDEEPAYAEECRKLVALFNLEDVITFTGKVQSKDYYPQTDVLVLSSISEGQPMVILEAYCLGIPVVTTDVGGCRDLVEGGISDLDKRLGPSGIVVPMGRSELLANAILKIIDNPEIYEKFSEIAKKRVSSFYREEMTVNSYLNLYHKLMS
ncbi:MAG: GT4 family glycosyltransferase PelF [Bacteriovoracaceae bacterium]|nr:GT4 family glycosyltransferase PelF [Bacteriovoracaceae bacterium]